MINLLPDNEKKGIEREYKLRRLATVLGAGCLLCIAALGAMVPSYILSLYKGSSTNTEVAKAAAVDQSEEQKSKQEIDTAQALVKVLQVQENSILPTKIIAYIVKDKTASNIVNDISYSRSEDDSTITIVVNGIAKTRQGLSQFNDAMKKEQGITSAIVPVSDFAKDSNIAYSMTITSTLK